MILRQAGTVAVRAMLSCSGPKRSKNCCCCCSEFFVVFVPYKTKKAVDLCKLLKYFDECYSVCVFIFVSCCMCVCVRSQQGFFFSEVKKLQKNISGLLMAAQKYIYIFGYLFFGQYWALQSDIIG